MSIKGKLFVSAAIVAVALVLGTVAQPVETQVANQATVNQLESNESSTFAAKTVGNGGGIVDTVLILLVGVALYFTWKKK